MKQAVYASFRDFIPYLVEFCGGYARDYDLEGAAWDLLDYSPERGGFVENGTPWIEALEAHPATDYYMCERNGNPGQNCQFTIARNSRAVARASIFHSVGAGYKVRFRDYWTGDTWREFEFDQCPSFETVMEKFARLMARSLRD